MIPVKPLALASIAAIALAACGDNQTAQQSAPATTAHAPSPEAATTAPPPARTAEGPTTAPPATMTMPPVNATPPNEQHPEVTGAVGAPAAAIVQRYQGRPFTSGAVTIRLEPDGAFEMREELGAKRVSGRYAAEGDVVTFETLTGDVAWTASPLRCRIAEEGEVFRLEEVQDSCGLLAGQTFRPAS